MKYTLRILYSALLCMVLGAAQAQSLALVPRMSYQTMVHDSTGQPMPYQAINVRLTIRDGGPLSGIVYREVQPVVTNALGTFSVVVGGGSIILGNINTINWSSGDKYLQVEMDPAGGASYIDMGTGPLLSVPYTLQTGTAMRSDADIAAISYDSAGILHLQTGGPLTVSPSAPVWTTTGNAGLGSNNYYAGTLDNTDFILKGRGVKGMTIGAGGSILVTGSTGTTPASGAGTRMSWAPGTASLRIGTAIGSAWDAANTGIGSIALGTDGIASAVNTISIGSDNVVSGRGASAMGTGLIARSAAVTVMGSYNDTTGSGSPTAWNAADPIFVVGNGTSDTSRSNAIVVTKGGATTVSSLVMNNAMALLDTLYQVTGGSYTLNVNRSSKVSMFVTNGGGADITLVPGLRIGQMVLFEVIASSNGHRAVFYDNVNTYHTNIAQSAGGALTLHDNDTITFMWDGTAWVEISHTLNY